jgi:hypothetical protein
LPRGLLLLPRGEMGDQSRTGEDAIEIRIEDIAQLFQSLDPFPFREKDLSKEAEEFIVGWARELPTDHPIRIIVHLPQTQASKPEAGELGTALTQFFDYRARITMLELNELFRVGRRALAIGVAILSGCVIAGQTAVASLAPNPLGRVVQESLMIFGWVANWKPIEIFLYDWWPIARRRNLYQRLARAEVKLRPYSNDQEDRIAYERASLRVVR